MAKAPKRAFVCNECGADYPRWQGQCSACHAWNTITEVRLAASPTVARNERLSGYAGSAGVAKVQKLSDISLEELPRFSTGFKEFDRVLGGGVVPGSAILIGGNPGAGKSTLLLQTLCKLAQQMKTLYVTGEESLQQVDNTTNILRLMLLLSLAIGVVLTRTLLQGKRTRWQQSPFLLTASKPVPEEEESEKKE